MSHNELMKELHRIMNIIFADDDKKEAGDKDGEKP